VAGKLVKMNKLNTVFLLTFTVLYDTLIANDPNCPHLCVGRHSYIFVAKKKYGIAVRQPALIEVEKKLLVDFVNLRYWKNVDTVVGQFDENVVFLVLKIIVCLEVTYIFGRTGRGRWHP